ncbi:MAG: hypothetical protein PVH96_11955 [Gemmatimonadota bacterium]|jgi:hypothetical protein
MEDGEARKEAKPWPQKVLDSVWLLALAAMVFFFLSYVLWGLIDLRGVAAGG